MSAHRCPVCNAGKAQRWHLVCPACWAKVPGPTQEEIYRLYKTARGSTAHAMKCREVVRNLYIGFRYERAERTCARPAGTPATGPAPLNPQPAVS